MRQKVQNLLDPKTVKEKPKLPMCPKTTFVYSDIKENFKNTVILEQNTDASVQVKESVTHKCFLNVFSGILKVWLRMF